MPATIVRKWETDEQYVLDQATDSSWSHDTEWGEKAAMKFMHMGDTLFRSGELYHNDAVADFGGNDGFSSYQFYRRNGIRPTVIDCEPTRLAFARREYSLPTLQCFIEDIPLPDNSIDWGFCSHTLEHTRDISRALKEMARVINRGCAFVVPLETKETASGNIAHAVCCTSIKQWKDLLNPHWRIRSSARTKKRCEAQIFAIPRKVIK